MVSKVLKEDIYIKRQKGSVLFMNKEKIENIFKRKKIAIKELNSATNSFSSNVYIITSTTGKKYVLKFCNKEKKVINEGKYMNYLKSYLPVSDVIEIGVCDEKYYIIQSFFEGNNIYDEKANELNDEQIRNIGILLAKLHSCKLLDEDNDSWLKYLNASLDKTVDTLEKILGKEENKKISKFLRKYIKQNLVNNYKNSILHMDFRIGNLMFGKENEIGLIDLEGMKNGEYVFDFVKMNRLFNKDKFEIFLSGYDSVKTREDNFDERLNFYSLFDSYTSLWWCVSKNRLDTDFYKLNYNIVIKYLERLNKTGNI